MFILILYVKPLLLPGHVNLHSTMFILILMHLYRQGQILTYLHSTMFILILVKKALYLMTVSLFTFHDVYINTLKPKTLNFQGSKLLFLSMLQKIIFTEAVLLLEIIYILILHALEVLSIPLKFYSIGGRQKKLKEVGCFFIFLSPEFFLHPSFLSAFENNYRVFIRSYMPF